MSFFGGYQKPGPGIDPNAPKKKPFFRFWELLRIHFGKLLSLNLIFTLCHAPLLLAVIIFFETNNPLTNAMVIFLFTVQFVIEGPTLAGCTRIMRLIVLDKPFFLGEEFKKGFQQNFLAALVFWLIDGIVFSSIIAGYYVYPQMVQETGSTSIYLIYGVSLAAALVLLCMNYYIMPLQAATTLKPRTIFKNAFMLVGLSLKRCLLTTACIAALIVLMGFLLSVSSYFMFLFAFFPAAFIGYLVMFVHYPVIQKFVINPYYAETGEQNPEEEVETPDEDRVFTDSSSTEEQSVQSAGSKKGKVIS